MKGKAIILILLAAGIGAAAYYRRDRPPQGLILTGIVTQDGVVVSSRIPGRIRQLLVKEGDVVKAGQLIAVLEPQELKAEQAYYLHNEEGATAQVEQAEAALRHQKSQTRDQIRQAEVAVTVAESQQAQAAAELDGARHDYERNSALLKEGVIAPQVLDRARTAFDVATNHVEALRRQVEAQQAALSLAHSNSEQVAVLESELVANRRRLAAAGSQKEKAAVVLGYTEIRSPIDGIVDVRAALQGEVVNAAQPVVTLIDPDGHWVRADIPESYIDQIHLGDQMTVRLPSGAERTGTVFFRGVDASFATQRDVSRSKRDIKTFEIRLRVDNSDRSLSLGLTAYVVMPPLREAPPEPR